MRLPNRELRIHIRVFIDSVLNFVCQFKNFYKLVKTGLFIEVESIQPTSMGVVLFFETAIQD
jgi:hypothetical protein